MQYFGVYAPPPSAPVDRQGQRRRRRAARLHGRPALDGHRRRDRPGRRRATCSTAAAASRASTASHGTPTTPRAPGTGTSRRPTTSNRQSTADQTFLYDLTLTGLKVPKSASGESGVKVTFTLSRPASVTLQIETKTGTVVARCPRRASWMPAPSRSPGTGRLGGRHEAPPGAYVARVTDTSSVGTIAHTASFTFRG